ENPPVPPSQSCGFDEPIDHAAQSGCREQRSYPIQRSTLRVTAFRNLPQGNYDHGSRERNIDEERPAPGSMFNQPSAKNRPARRRDRAESGPSPNRLASGSLVKVCANDGKAAGHKKSSS